MAIIDVREVSNEEITEIVFADEIHTDGYEQAFKIDKNSLAGNNYICICDTQDSTVIINTEEHAQNLIKALNKAIELGRLK